jgi:predicted Fe-Mo cluster-binding NifX family protein
MKVAFSSWNNRIAPVFDVARQIFLLESHEDRVLSETEETLPPDDLGAKARQLAVLRVNTLVCGAISHTMRDLILSYGIELVPFVAGNLREVIDAWVEGRIHDKVFAMPGCCPEGRGRRGKGAGMRSGRGLCAGDGADTDSVCVCPQCSHREPHERGIPCTQKRCPACGSAMIKGRKENRP